MPWGEEEVVSYVRKFVRPDRFPKMAIMCTVGPSVFKVQPAGRGLTVTLNRLEELVDAGMSVVRINFSWVPKAKYRETKLLIQEIRKLEEKRRLPIPIVMDLKGPEIRIKDIVAPPERVHDGVTMAEKGDLVWLSQNRHTSPPSRTNPLIRATVVCHFDFCNVVKKRIVVGDNELYLRVAKVVKTGGASCRGVLCRALHHGGMKKGKGLNLPDNRLSDVDPIVPEDRAAIKAGFDVDFIAQSFVRSAGDVRRLLRVIDGTELKGTPIIAKIETPDGVEDIESILKIPRVYGIMVARGDLGVLMDYRRLPRVQRQLIDRANILGKPVIVATQVLESMVERPKPWRPEVEGIENAILWGADSLMLSGETASGSYAPESVRVTSEIVRVTRFDRDAYLRKFRGDFRIAAAKPKPIDFVGNAICEIAKEARSPYIASYATTGVSASRISRFRPERPILAITLDEKQARQLRLLHNVYTVYVDPRRLKGGLPRKPKEFIRFVRQIMQEMGLAARVRGKFVVGTLELTRVTNVNSRGIVVFAS